MSTLKSKLKKKLNLIRPFGLVLLAISRWRYSKILPLRWLSYAILCPLYFILRDDYYKFLIYTQKIADGQDTSKLSRFQPCQKLLRAVTGDKSYTAEEYAEYLNEKQYPADEQHEWSRRFIEVGRLDLAHVGFVSLLNRAKNRLSIDKQLQTYRLLGAVCFMLGKNHEALEHWEAGGKLRRIMFKPSTPKTYRILGPSWFVAIGHVAMLDYYLKFRKLYPVENLRIVVAWDLDKMPGVDLLLKFAELGITILKPDQLENDYDDWAKCNNALMWHQLSEVERAALVDDFWEYDFPDGQILGYAHAAARIQQEWENAGLAPLIQLNQMEKEWIASYLTSLGVPAGAWFVCLHVREAGFHKEWNSIYPSMRDANIEDYYPAIKQIVDAGGWVLRMGDSSMRTLPKMKNVIDYAHYAFKTPTADIMLAASCRFFLGTNSGFATVPAIYNVPCLLTNWMPIGWPLWPSQDLLLPKLFKNKNSGTYLTVEQIFSQGLAFIQNWSDLPEHIELVSNTPDEITDATVEMLSHFGLSNSHMKVGVSDEIQDRYKKLAIDHHAFTGSRFSHTFSVRHPDLFELEQTEFNVTTIGRESTWQEQLSNNTMVTSS